MSSNAVRRTALGFQGGQVLSLRLPEEVLSSLRDTLKEGRERWMEGSRARKKPGMPMVRLETRVRCRGRNGKARPAIPTARARTVA